MVGHNITTSSRTEKALPSLWVGPSVFKIMVYGRFTELTIGKATVLIKEGIRVSCY